MTEDSAFRSGRDDALDGMRAVAALMVVCYHCGANVCWPPLVAFGFTGVHLFFVLSGYLIARPFLARLLRGQPLPDWKGYAVRRFTRIYPTYFVALVFYTVMRELSGLHPPTFANIAKHALLVFNFGNPADFFSLNIVMWSLVIEAQFYVVLPLAANALAHSFPSGSRHAASALVVVFALVGLASRGAEYALTPIDGVRFRAVTSFLDLFATGMLAAQLELMHGDALRSRVRARASLAVAGLALYFGLNYWSFRLGVFDWFKPSSLGYVWVYPLGISAAFGALLLVLRTRASYPIALLTWPPVTFFGRISYSIYLYHVAVGFVLLAKLPRPLGSWLGTHNWLYSLAEMPLVLAVSYVAYRFVELPSIGWGAKFSLREPPPGSAA